MARSERLLARILRGQSDANIPFQELCRLLEGLGFSCRVRGDHHIFTRDEVDEILNLQPKSGEGQGVSSQASSGGHPEVPFGEMNVVKYEIIIYWSREDEAFIAEVPELPGCAADGETYQEALDNVQVIIREWIETARELGREIPEPKGRHIFA